MVGEVLLVFVVLLLLFPATGTAVLGLIINSAVCPAQGRISSLRGAVRLSRIRIVKRQGLFSVEGSAAFVGASYLQMEGNTGLRSLVEGVPNVRCSGTGERLSFGKGPLGNMGVGNRAFVNGSVVTTLRGVPASTIRLLGLCSVLDTLRGVAKMSSNTSGCILSVGAGSACGNDLAKALATRRNGHSEHESRMRNGLFGTSNRGASLALHSSGLDGVGVKKGGFRGVLSNGVIGGFNGGVALGTDLSLGTFRGKDRGRSCSRRCLSSKAGCQRSVLLSLDGGRDGTTGVGLRCGVSGGALLGVDTGKGFKQSSGLASGAACLCRHGATTSALASKALQGGAGDGKGGCRMSTSLAQQVNGTKTSFAIGTALNNGSGRAGGADLSLAGFRRLHGTINKSSLLLHGLYRRLPALHGRDEVSLRCARPFNGRLGLRAKCKLRRRRSEGADGACSCAVPGEPCVSDLDCRGALSVYKRRLALEVSCGNGR